MSIDLLQTKIRKMKNPTMVCICPNIMDIPMPIRERAIERFGHTLQAAAEAYREFSCGILDALQPIVPAVSIVSGAFFALGADGVRAMEQVLRFAAECGYYVLLDTARADIGVSAQMLANACFGSIQVGEQNFTPYPCDGVMMSAYPGSDAVMPFIGFCEKGKNVFVVSHSSNKSAKEVQDLISGDRLVYQVMADLAMRWSRNRFAQNGFSEIGICVGATNPSVLARLRKSYDRLFFLVPGYGAQGAGAREASAAFNQIGHGAAILAGRSILYAYQKEDDSSENYQSHARLAAEGMRTQLLNYVRIY